MQSIKLDVTTECGELLYKANDIIKGYGHIVGEALRSYFEGNIPKDIDVFCVNSCHYEDLILKVITLGYRYTRGIRIIDNYIAIDFEFHGSILSIIRPTMLYGRYTYGKLEYLIDDIDINICRLGLNWNDIIVTTDFMVDITKAIDNRQFHFVKIREGELDRNIVRIKKYEGYGYTHSIKGE